MSNIVKIGIVQAIRVVVDLIAVLVILGAIVFNPGIGASFWLLIGIGDVLLWIAIEAALTMYLECLYERDTKR